MNIEYLNKKMEELFQNTTPEEFVKFCESKGFKLETIPAATEEAPLQEVRDKEEGKEEKRNVVYGNSTAFRDWLDSQNIEWLASDQCTILIGELDLFDIGTRWGKYKLINEPKPTPQPASNEKTIS